MRRTSWLSSRMLELRPPRLEILAEDAAVPTLAFSLTVVSPLLAVAFALLRDPETLPRSALLMEVASLPTVPEEDRRVVVEVPEALLPEPEVLAEELRVAVVAEERRVVPDCGAAVEVLPLLRETLLPLLRETLLPLLRETLLPDPLVPVVELRRFCPLCTAEELLREALLP